MSPPVFDEYLKTTGKPIEASIRGELSGDFEKLMLAVGKLDASAWPGTRVPVRPTAGDGKMQWN